MQTKEQKLEKRRLRERRPEFRERHREYKASWARAYLAANPDKAQRNKERSLARYYELKAHAWLAVIFREPVAELV